MEFVYNDGGRKKAGYKGQAGDCVVRAIAIATGIPYQRVYEDINHLALRERKGKRKRGISNARTGVYKRTYHKYLESLGWKWVPTMFVGQGCKVHLNKDELPLGTLILSVSKHLTTMIDGVIHDTHNPQRKGLITENGITRFEERSSRCVYGYFYNPKEQEYNTYVY